MHLWVFSKTQDQQKKVSAASSFLDLSWKRSVESFKDTHGCCFYLQPFRDKQQSSNKSILPLSFVKESFYLCHFHCQQPVDVAAVPIDHH